MRNVNLRHWGNWWYLIVAWFYLSGCVNDYKPLESSFVYIEPDYNGVQLHPTTDSLHFYLEEDFYSTIKSFSTFVKDGVSYLAFFDKQSRSVCIFNMNDPEEYTRFYLSESLVGKRMNNVTVYCKSFDSILVNTMTRLCIIDTTGKPKRTFRLKKEDELVQTILENGRPPVFTDSFLYSGVRPSFNSRSASLQKKLRLMYAFNLKDKTPELLYNFPESYRKSYLGFNYLDYNYCYNNEGKFVVSYSGDPNIYVTDLKEKSTAYFGRSSFQTKEIESMGGMPDSSLLEYKHYSTHYSYGPIYFDHVRKRYLRVGRTGITEKEFDDRDEKGKRKQYLIIFDEKFRVIGESRIDSNIALNYLHVTQDGRLFARTKAKDEYAIHFVQLQYEDKPDVHQKTAQK